MNNQRFYSYIGLSIVSAAATIVATQTLSGYSGVLAGITALAALGFYELADEQANRTGKDRNIKISLSATKPLYEAMILSAALMGSIIPSYLTVSVLGAVLLSQLVEEKMVIQLRQRIKPRFNQRLRIATTALALLLSTLNPFYLFYGMWIVGIIASYDLADIIYRSTRP